MPGIGLITPVKLSRIPNYFKIFLTLAPDKQPLCYFLHIKHTITSGGLVGHV
jgi:hypothetical protein